MAVASFVWCLIFLMLCLISASLVQVQSLDFLRAIECLYDVTTGMRHFTISDLHVVFADQCTVFWGLVASRRVTVSLSWIFSMPRPFRMSSCLGFARYVGVL